jgi:hypothetical protein
LFFVSGFGRGACRAKLLKNQAAVLWPQGAPRLSAHGSMMGLKITSTLMTSALGSVMMGVKAFLGK